MMHDAGTSPVVLRVREAVPEFERRFQFELEEELGEMGSFQAMSTFAEWVLDKLQSNPDAPEVERSFRVIEEIASSGRFHMGRALVTEFVERLEGDVAAISLLGPSSRYSIATP